MSVITDIVLLCNDDDLAMATSRQFCGMTDNPWQLKQLATIDAGGDKVFCEIVLAASVNYLDHGAFIKMVEIAPWEAPENVLVMIKHENDVRPAVWGFAGARYFGSVDEPRNLVCLVEAVPS